MDTNQMFEEVFSKCLYLKADQARLEAQVDRLIDERDNLRGERDRFRAENAGLRAAAETRLAVSDSLPKKLNPVPDVLNAVHACLASDSFSVLPLASNKINLIKFVRILTGLCLKESKDIVESAFAPRLQ